MKGRLLKFEELRVGMKVCDEDENPLIIQECDDIHNVETDYWGASCLHCLLEGCTETIKFEGYEPFENPQYDPLYEYIPDIKDINWVVQRNLVNEEDLARIHAAIIETGCRLTEVEVVPFSSELPDFIVDVDNVYLGSTTFMYNLYKDLEPKGLFFNENFKMENYDQKWGEHMLNYGAIHTNLALAAFLDYPENKLFFIRPNEDSKVFDGEVRDFGYIKNWNSRIMKFDNVELSGETEIILAEPWNVNKEWRIYIVGGEIITATKYRENFKLNKSAEDIPEDMIAFAQARLNEYKPHDNFVMDIALCGDAYYIIECGCLNGAGAYKADFKKIVEAINKWMFKN